MRIFTVDVPKKEIISVTITASTASVVLRMKGGGPVLHSNNLAAGPTGAALFGGAAPTLHDFESIAQKDGIGFLSPSRQFNQVEYLQSGITRLDFYAPKGPGTVEVTVI